MFLSSQLRHIAASTTELQPVLTSQSRNKRLIRLRLRPAQLVIEMNNRKNETKLLPQFNEQAEQSNRINPTRNRNPNPVPSPQQFLPPDMPQHALRQFMHANMVPHSTCGDSRLGYPAERSEAGLQGVPRRVIY
jgi:hypothetical protein